MVEESAEPSTRVDCEQSSFVPQCHAGTQKVKIMQITGRKRRRDWGERGFSIFSSLRLRPRSLRLRRSLLVRYHILQWRKRKIRDCLQSTTRVDIWLTKHTTKWMIFTSFGYFVNPWSTHFASKYVALKNIHTPVCGMRYPVTSNISPRINSKKLYLNLFLIFWIQKITVLIRPPFYYKGKISQKSQKLNSSLLISTFTIYLFYSFFFNVLSGKL